MREAATALFWFMALSGRKPQAINLGSTHGTREPFAPERTDAYTRSFPQNVGGVQAEITSQALPPTQRKRCGLRLSK